MAAPDPLAEFVRDALVAGHPRAEIQRALAAAGWPAADVDKALAGFADVPFVPPVPRPRPQVSAREAFTYAILFTALGFTASNVVTLVHALIDRWLPPPGAVVDPHYLAATVRWAIATLVVSTPLYLWLTLLTNRRLAKEPSARRSPVRRWITHAALFIAALGLFGDAVYTIYRFLGDELTLPFLLKAGTVAAVCALILVVYLGDVADGAKQA